MDGERTDIPNVGPTREDDGITFTAEFPDIDVPDDLVPFTHANATPECDRKIRKQLGLNADNVDCQFDVYESSIPEDHEKAEPAVQDDGDLFATEYDRVCGGGSSDLSPDRHCSRGKESTVDDKTYRSDREFLKRQSHRKMMWFMRRVGLRHPAAIRTHLERVKHPEFEIPNLGCVYPHPGLSIAVDERWEHAEAEENDHSKPKKRRAAAEGIATITASGRYTQTATNMTHYQLYCASATLVERVKSLMGPPKSGDNDYNKRVLTFIADIVGRLLWHNNRTHTVMFAKSDHYDRECFLLYSRQAEPTPYFMHSDSYFCRRHDSEKFKFVSPQPDLTRANSTRLSNDSAIYVVGCSWTDMWETFGYEYRITNCRRMKPLYDSIRQIDAAVMEHTFSGVDAYVNGDLRDSPYVDTAARTSFDILSVLLREADLNATVADDSTEYRSYVERFVTLGILNVNCLLKLCRETEHSDGHASGRGGLDPIVLHNVRYRREVRELRTNRVFYYRNTRGFVSSLSLVDDVFEGCDGTLDDVGEHGEKNNRLVYFYDLLQDFGLGENEDMNHLAFHDWEEASCMIHESSYTIGQYLTSAAVLNGTLPDDPFYPKSTMSPTDLAIDRVLERALKHSKKLKLPTPTDPVRRSTRGRTTTTTATRRRNKSESRQAEKEDGRPRVHGLSALAGPEVDRDVVANAFSRTGENRLGDGYTSPPRPVFETDHLVQHKGEEYRLKISYGDQKRTDTAPVDYGPLPTLRVDEKLLCVYLIDPKNRQQIRLLPGVSIVDKDRPGYVKMTSSDRIVRVFAIQATGETSYVVKPYVFFVFRNMPTCEIDKTLIDEMFGVIASYDSFDAYKVFDEGAGNDQDDGGALQSDGQYGVPYAYDLRGTLDAVGFPCGLHQGVATSEPVPVREEPAAATSAVPAFDFLKWVDDDMNPG